MTQQTTDRRRSGLRSTLSRWASVSSQEAKELRVRTEKAGCCPIKEIEDRQRVELAGTLRTVTLRPRGGVPALEAEMYDGSGVITLVWLGRRRIKGVEPGKTLKVSGRVGMHDRHRIMFNPRYELRP